MEEKNMKRGRNRRKRKLGKGQQIRLMLEIEKYK
jgi:hypothetical protein